MTVRSWVPLLRQLRAAGWEHTEYSMGDCVEHVWRRNRTALNMQQISWNITGAQVFIGDESHTTTSMDVRRAWRVLEDMGAFDPKPEPRYPNRPVLSAVS